ncbi:MAG: hypothetical protein K6F88_04630 [Ruminococcus sp.]|nr:hypothetical protein [Ruminococcus sp.]
MKKEQSIIRQMAAESVKRRKATKRHFYFSIISLVIVFAVFVTVTFSWFSINTAKINAGLYTLQCGKGLRVNDSGESDFQLNNISKYIIPASSIDGRNLFFPTDGSDFSKETEKITYRSANVGDKNKNYVQIDFTLTAQENNTALYINDAVTSLTVSQNGNESSTLAAPLRVAIWAGTQGNNEAPNAPIVFNPTGRTFNTAAVASVDSSSGALINTGRQTSHAFSDYAYGGKPIATLSKGIETKLSIIIWLEGADPKSSKLQDSTTDINFSIAFSTSWDKTQVIRFKDETGGSGNTGWVKTLLKDGITENGKTVKYDLYLHYEKYGSSSADDITDFLMYPHNVSTIANATEWMCNMPGDMTNKVSFELRPSDSSYPTYKFTRSSKVNGADTYDRDVNKLYVAEESAKPTAQANYGLCKGYWKALGDSDGGGSDNNDLEGDDF